MNPGGGRVIPHAVCFEALASAPIPLAIAVIESAFRALAMAAAGAPEAGRTSLVGATEAAVDVPTVAASANGEDGLAARASGQPRWRLHRIHDGSSNPTKTSPSTLPNVRKRATIRAGRACCLEDRGSSNRGLGAPTPSPHLLLAMVGQDCGDTPLRPAAQIPHPRAKSGSALRAEAWPLATPGTPGACAI